VELAVLAGDRLAIRNSRDPEGPTLICPHAELHELVAAAKKW
jgi:hypothetical protein